MIGERETKGNLGFSGTVWLQLSLLVKVPTCVWVCYLFVFVQAWTASQELLGLRKPILALSNCVFSSGIQLTRGGDARHSGILFLASFSPPAVFPSDVCGTYPQSCEREEQITNKSNEKFLLWPLKGGVESCAYLDLSNLFTRSLELIQHYLDHFLFVLEMSAFAFDVFKRCKSIEYSRV